MNPSHSIEEKIGEWQIITGTELTLEQFQALRALIQSQREELVQNVGFLRQWLNEDRITDPNKMITNEDILRWLALLPIKSQQ